MSDLKLVPGGDDPEVTEALRAIYRAPADPGYWSSLEERIVSRLAQAEIGWWSELDRWMRPALVAAAVLVIGATVALMRDRQAEARIAYTDILTPTAIPVETAVRPMLQGERDATLRYIIAR